LVIGDIVVDFVAATIRGRSGLALPLRAQSFAVLEYLARHCDRVVARDELIHAVWGDQAVTDDSLVQCIHEIRRVLNDANKTLLRTVPKRGYCLVRPQDQPTFRFDWRLPAAAVIVGAVAALVGCMSWCLLAPEGSVDMAAIDPRPAVVTRDEPTR
jgi:hypothetical protein